MEEIKICETCEWNGNRNCYPFCRECPRCGNGTVDNWEPKQAQKKQRNHAAPGTLGARVRELRLSKGLTQKGLADASGLTQRVVETVEINRNDPSFLTLVTLADFFGVSMDYIAGRDPKYYGGKKK